MGLLTFKGAREEGAIFGGSGFNVGILTFQIFVTNTPEKDLKSTQKVFWAIRRSVMGNPGTVLRYHTLCT